MWAICALSDCNCPDSKIKIWPSAKNTAGKEMTERKKEQALWQRDPSPNGWGINIMILNYWIIWSGILCLQGSLVYCKQRYMCWKYLFRNMPNNNHCCHDDREVWPCSDTDFNCLIITANSEDMLEISLYQRLTNSVDPWELNAFSHSGNLHKHGQRRAEMHITLCEGFMN